MCGTIPCMITGIGYSERYPDLREEGYLTWALAQTPLDHVNETASAIDGARSLLRSSGIPRHGDQLSPFAETLILDTLGMEAATLRSNIIDERDGHSTDRILMFADNHRGNFYASIGDVLGWSGHGVTVASPDLARKQSQAHANAGITYLRKSMGELGENDATPGFTLAIVDNISYRMDRDETWQRPGGERERFSPQEKLRRTLGVLQPAGRLLIATAQKTKQIRRVLDNDSELSDEISASYDMAYLQAYAINMGHPQAVEPLLVFERRESS